jgi:hypothetical protein
MLHANTWSTASHDFLPSIALFGIAVNRIRGAGGPATKLQDNSSRESLILAAKDTHLHDGPEE